MEKHSHGNWLRDVILGGQDGLVNVLGIVLGVSAANGGERIIIAASLAAAFAEAVSMAAVAYTSALSEKDFYEKEQQREILEMETVPERETEEIRDIYRQKGFSGKLLEDIVHKLTGTKELWLKTMMNEELNLKPIDTAVILRTSIIVGITALLASFIPVGPFFFLSRSDATVVSLVISGVALFFVGVYQAKTFVGVWWKKGIQMIIIGLGAALAGFLIGKFFQVS